MPVEVGAFIVDDEPDIRALVNAVIRVADDGLVVVGEACDGEEAVERIDEVDPTVVVLDNRLPGIDGIETARRIRAARPNQAIVLFTAFLDDRARADAAKAGIGKCLAKGEVDQLPDAIWELAGGRPA
jgi:DNA-binding NarL/FixJ family response regulator